MRWVRAVWDEVFGLFVDDGSFAVAILAWLAVVWLGVRFFGLSSGWVGPGLFAGLAVILAESVGRASRR